MVVATAAGIARVTIDGVEWQAENPSGLTGTVTMAVRSEDIELGGSGLPARIEVRNFLGNLVEYKVRLATGATVRVQAPPSAPYDEGAPVAVGIRRGLLFGSEETTSSES
jgi:hypothetical protein